jgi:hypothetical protein
LEFPGGNDDDVAFANPDAAFHFASDAAEPFCAVLTFNHDAVKAEKFGDYTKHFALAGVNHFANCAFT